MKKKKGTKDRNFLYPYCLASFIYFILYIYLEGMRIDINKRDKVRMGETHPKPSQSSSLGLEVDSTKTLRP